MPSMMWPNQVVQAPLSVILPMLGIRSQLPVAFASWMTDWSQPERPRPGWSMTKVARPFWTA